jgi:hypothetical protein
VQYFRDNPSVTVEIENYSPDLSTFGFVALHGRLVEIDDVGEKSTLIGEKYFHGSRRLFPICYAER